MTNMEVVSNLTAAASKAIWGDSTTENNETKGQEPLSGEKGNTEAGEPYDKGNVEPSSSTTTAPIRAETSSVPHENVHAQDLPTETVDKNLEGTTLEPITDKADPTLNQDTSSSSSTAVRPLTNEPTGEKPITTTTNNLPTPNFPILGGNPSLSVPTDSTTTAVTALDDGPQDLTSKTGVTALDSAPQDVKPSSSSPAPIPGAQDSISQFGGADDPVMAAAKAETAADAAKPVGGLADTPSSSDNLAGVKTDLSAANTKPEAKVDDSRTSGDSGKFVKSEGIAAEGGNFDAAKPGAGKEAEGLVGKDSGEDVGEEHHGKEGKPGKMSHLKEKIKEKLHKH
ncbi:glycine-rich cell wall structural 1 protein [Rutstroemia sp. NJR-2017a BVV2]|nr:glycine-rich cell wall structural 1 protein [Rutstroemia sp. NJR-2017a BVV2]